MSGSVQTIDVRQEDFRECWAELGHAIGRGAPEVPTKVEPVAEGPQPLQPETEVDTTPVPVELYLAKALKLAAEAGQWSLVAELSGQLSKLTAR